MESAFGVEVGQSYLLELMFDNKLIRSTHFVNGVFKGSETFSVRTLSDVAVAGWSVDGMGRITEGLTINRGEADFSPYVLRLRTRQSLE
jgi:hypothetical protein